MKHQKGFTLIEVLVGVGILSIMCLLIFSTMNRVLNSKNRVENRDGLLHEVRIGLTKMTEDLSQAFVTNKAMNGPLGKEVFISGMKGGEDHLDFTTMGHFHYLKGTKDTDQAVIGYTLQKNDHGLYDLMRRETGRLSEKLDEGGISFALIEDVKSLKLTYYDSNKKDWVSEWDSNQESVLGRLPMIIKIELTVAELKDDDSHDIAKEYEFMTATNVEMYKNAIEF